MSRTFTDGLSAVSALSKVERTGFWEMFRWVVTVMGALQKVYIPSGSLIEALYTLNSPPVVSFDGGERQKRGLGFGV